MQSYKSLIIRPENVSIMLRRAPGPVQPKGSRAMHLLHNLFVGPSGYSQLALIRKRKCPSAEDVMLTLHETPSNKLITMKVSELLPRLKPRSYLTQTVAGTTETPATYRIKIFDDPAVKHVKNTTPTSKKYYKRRGRSKETHFTTDCSASHYSHRLKLAYAFLLEGSRMEFHIRQPSKDKVRTADWAMTNNVHLRPDVIQAAMPEGTTMLAHPATTDASLRYRIPKKAGTKSEIFWALENPAVLKKLKLQTPDKIKKLGTWNNHLETVEPKMAPAQPHHPGQHHADDDDPPLSDLVPQTSAPSRDDEGEGLVTGSSNPEDKPNPEYRFKMRR